MPLPLFLVSISVHDRRGAVVALAPSRDASGIINTDGPKKAEPGPRRRALRSSPRTADRPPETTLQTRKTRWGVGGPFLPSCPPKCGGRDGVQEWQASESERSEGLCPGQSRNRSRSPGGTSKLWRPASRKFSRPSSSSHSPTRRARSAPLRALRSPGRCQRQPQLPASLYRTTRAPRAAVPVNTRQHDSPTATAARARGPRSTSRSSRSCGDLGASLAVGAGLSRPDSPEAAGRPPAAVELSGPESSPTEPRGDGS